MRALTLRLLLVASAFGGCTASSDDATAPGIDSDVLDPATLCSNGQRDDGEAGVDCGGACGPCADVGQPDTCGAECSTCDNGQQDGDEEGIDCGGSCAACVVVNSCFDAQLNGAESDVDCGGGCAGCTVGRACSKWSDCASGTCISGFCAAPIDHCLDGALSGDETDKDCGGSCAPCGQGSACLSGLDCDDLPCLRNVCAAPTCDDLVRNGDETDVDCGGPECDPCSAGKQCLDDDDCNDFACDLTASGGPVCAGCDDSVLNGDETDVDCGGWLCQPCAVGLDCLDDLDCADALLCDAERCCAPNSCGACGAPPVEVCNGVDDDCDGLTDEDLAPPLCPLQVGECAGSVALCKGGSGWQCSAAVYASTGAYEANETLCDEKDNDCDGVTDEGECAACEAGLVEAGGFTAWSDLLVGDEFFAWSGGPIVLANGADGDGQRWLLSGDEDEVVAVVPSDAAAPSLYVGPEGRFASHVAGGDLTLVDLMSATAPLHVRNVGAVSTGAPLAIRDGLVALGFAGNDGFLRVDFGSALTPNAQWSVADLGLSPDLGGLALAMTPNGTVHALWRQGGTLVHGNPLGQPYVVDADLTGPADIAVAEDDGIYVSYVRAGKVLVRRRDPSWQWYGETVVGTAVGSDAVAVTLDEFGARFVSWSPGVGRVALARVSKLGPEPLGEWDLPAVGAVQRIELLRGTQGAFRLGVVVRDTSATLAVTRIVVATVCPGQVTASPAP